MTAAEQPAPRPDPGPGPSLHPDQAPDWLVPLVRGCAAVDPDDVPLRRRVGVGARREAAVLVLFADDPAGPDGPDGPDLLLTERASDLRDHAGQAAFPGGGVDDTDADLVATALREAQEETGVDPDGVVPLVTLPPLTIPVTGFAVTPVIAHWRRPVEVGVVDPGETAAVVRVPLTVLADPAHRFTVTGPSGYTGPAFAVGGLLVWGFTALLVSWLLELGGWARPWDTTDVRDLEDVWRHRHQLSSAPDDPDRHRGGTIR